MKDKEAPEMFAITVSKHIINLETVGAIVLRQAMQNAADSGKWAALGMDTTGQCSGEGAAPRTWGRGHQQPFMTHRGVSLVPSLPERVTHIFEGKRYLIL